MTTRFPVAVDDPLRNAGWKPGRWDIRQAEQWADTLRGHVSPGGHRHAVLPAAVEVWAEFGTLHIAPTGPGRHIAPAHIHIDPLAGLHAARTFNDLGRALGTQVCPIGAESECGEYGGHRDHGEYGAYGEYGQYGAYDGAAGTGALLAIDAQHRVYSLDATGDWYLGADFDSALSALLMGLVPAKLSAGTPPPAAAADPSPPTGRASTGTPPPAQDEQEHTAPAEEEHSTPGEEDRTVPLGVEKLTLDATTGNGHSPAGFTTARTE